MMMSHKATSRHQSTTAWLLVLALLGMPSCLEQTSDPVPDWPGTEEPDLSQALLLAETVQNRYAGDEPIQSEQGQVAQPLVGDDAVLFKPLRDSLNLANAVTFPVLTLFNRIARNNEPTLSSADLAVWQVTADGVSHTLLLERDADNAGKWNYNWSLRPEGASDAGAQVGMTGFYIPGPLDGGKQTGTGLLRIDYGAFSLLPNVSGDGRGVVSFRSSAGGALSTNFFFEEFFANDRQLNPINAEYTYRLRSDESGQAQFILLDVPLNNDEIDRVGATAVWNSNGAAKARAVFDDDRLIVDIFVDECWDVARKQVWIEYDPDPGELSDGLEADCDGDLAELELTLPDLTNPPQDQDPDIPDE